MRETGLRTAFGGWLYPGLWGCLVIVGFGLMVAYTPVNWTTIYGYRIWFFALFAPYFMVILIRAWRRHLSVEVRTLRHQPPKQYVVTNSSIGVILIVGALWAAYGVGFVPAHQRLASACAAAPYDGSETFCPCLMRVVSENPVRPGDIEALGKYFSSQNINVFKARNPGLKDEIDACSAR